MDGISRIDRLEEDDWREKRGDEIRQKEEDREKTEKTEESTCGRSGVWGSRQASGSRKRSGDRTGRPGGKVGMEREKSGEAMI